MENIDITIYEGSGFSTVFTIKDSNNIAIPLANYTFDMVFYNDLGTEILVAYSEADTGLLFLTGTVGEIQLKLDVVETAKIESGYYTLTINDGTIPVQIVTGYTFVIETDKSNLSYLIPFVRLKIGDINPASYRYLDEWLLIALGLSIKNLQKYWNYKYIVDANGVVSRNPNSTQFLFSAPPIIETGDEYPIILMTSIIILEGSLENSAWDVTSWSDAEIRYTNIDSGRIREASIKRLYDELNSILLPPTKRLASALKSSLPGYKGNDYEYKSD